MQPAVTSIDSTPVHLALHIIRATRRAGSVPAVVLSPCVLLIHYCVILVYSNIYTTMLRCAGLVLLVQSPLAVRGHGAMLNPPPRNAIDSTIPGADWGSGENHTGILENLGVQCENGTEPCKPGQSVFWFSQVRTFSSAPFCLCAPWPRKRAETQPVPARLRTG